MKKVIFMLVMMLCIHTAKAQYTTVMIKNNTTMPSMYCMFYGNNPPNPCLSLGPMTGWVGPISTSGYSTFTFAGVSPFFPTTPPWSSTGLAHFIFGQPWSPGIDAIPRVDACTVPITFPTMSTNFTMTSMTISMSSPSPGTLVIDINP